MIDHLLDQHKPVFIKRQAAPGLGRFLRLVNAALQLAGPTATRGPDSVHLRYDCGESDLREADLAPPDLKLAAYAASFEAMLQRRF